MPTICKLTTRNMTQRRPSFRQSDISRAIKAATAAGMVVARCEISPDGRIVLSTVATESVEDVFGAWKSRREGRVERHS